MLPAIIFKLAQGGCEQVADNLAGTCESYEESELTGLSGVTTVFHIEGDKIVLTRSGRLSSQMV